MPSNTIRRTTLPAIDRVKRSLFDGYAVSDSTVDEYALTVYEPKRVAEAELDEAGFSRNLISALKIRVDGNVSDGSWVYRDSLFADKQLHLVLHVVDDERHADGDGDDLDGDDLDTDGNARVDVYAHTELSWITNPVAHYEKESYSASEGIELTRELFETLDVEYEIRPRYRREEKWLLYGIYLVSKPAARRARTLVDAAHRYLPIDGPSGKPNLPFLDERS